MRDAVMAPETLKADPETRPGQLPLPEEGMGSLAYWQAEIKASQEQIEKKLPEWRKNLSRYQNQPLDARPTQDTIWVPKDFALAERKRSQLWFRAPELFCQPKPGQTPQTAQAAPVFAAVLNAKMGAEEFDADTVMTEVTFDAICPAGVMVSTMTYEASTDGETPIEVGTDPVTGAPITEMAPNIIHEQFAWERVSPASLIAPADWVGSRYDRAPFLGYRFDMDRELAKRKWDLSDDECPKGRGPLQTLNESEDRQAERANREVVTGVFLEYKASLYRPEVKHPQCLYELVLLDGMDQPVVHRKSPHQTFDEQTGKLSVDSVRVYTTRVGSVRTVSDGKFPNSDCQQSRPQVDELSKGRTQMIQQRNRAIPLRTADRNRVDSKDLQRIVKGEVQEIIPVDGDGREIIHELSKAQYPRENFAFNDQIEKDLEECWALGANQLAQDDPDSTATEASIKQRNTDARLAKEREAVKRYFVDAVTLVAAPFIQRYSTATDYVEIVGTVGAQILAQSALLGWAPDPQQAADPNTPTTVAWNNQTVQGTFLWTIKPDSQLRTDMQQERLYRRQVYAALRRDPLVNASELVKWVLEAEGLNGAQFLAQPQSPPEPVPSISISIKGDDLNPAMPQYANVAQILTVDGKPAQLAPADVVPQVPHEGMMPEAENLSKHQDDLTGAMPGPSGEANTGGV